MIDRLRPDRLLFLIAKRTFLLRYFYWRCSIPSDGISDQAKGNGVAQNYSEVSKWFRLAATQGNVKAQITLGLMYEKGYGIDQSFTEAHNWYKLAADQGSSTAEQKIVELEML